jgi:methionyl-tRNA synthetase
LLPVFWPAFLLTSMLYLRKTLLSTTFLKKI